MSSKRSVNIDVHHLTRVEGHGDIHVVVEQGELKEVRFDVVEAPRYFEAMLLDKKLSSAYEITSRICGICSTSHTLTSLNAIESLLQLEPSPQTRLIRDLAMCSELLSSHVLHICFLAAPDFLGAPSVIPLVETNPELVLKALRLKRIANIISEKVCGRHTHPLTLVIGGVTYLPKRADLEELQTMIQKEFLPGLQYLVKAIKGLKLPDMTRETEYLCLDNFYREPAGGTVIKSSDGAPTPLAQYRQKIKEYVLPTSTAKFAKANRSSYMVGALARWNNIQKDLCKEAREVAAALKLPTPCHNPFLITVAQLVESVHFAVKASDYINQLLTMDLKEEPLPELKMRAGIGVGATEAPRGLLLHEYTTMETGYITGANCIIPTNQNLGNINEDLRELLPQQLKQNQDDAAITLGMEMLVRAYDPLYLLLDPSGPDGAAVSWQQELMALQGKQVLLVGIGNPQRGDDAIGMVIAAELEKASLASPNKLRVYQAGTSPEDCLSLALEEKPEVVVLLDGCEAGLAPGEIILLNGEKLPERSNSTHTMSPRLIGRIIEKFTGAAVYYLGVQVKDYGWGQEMSPEVKQAGAEIVGFFKEVAGGRILRFEP